MRRCALKKISQAREPRMGAPVQIEGQKAEQARRQQEQAALMKLEKIRLDQTQRAQTLEEEAREAEQKVRPHAIMAGLSLDKGCPLYRCSSAETPEEKARQAEQKVRQNPFGKTHQYLLVLPEDKGSCLPCCSAAQTAQGEAREVEQRSHPDLLAGITAALLSMRGTVRHWLSSLWLMPVGSRREV